MKLLTLTALCVASFAVIACRPASVTVTPPEGAEFKAAYYPGDDDMDDVFIVDDKNHYGKMVDSNWPESLNFSLKAGGKVALTCKGVEEIKSGDDTDKICTQFEVTSTDLAALPQGSLITLPRSMFADDAE